MPRNRRSRTPYAELLDEWLTRTPKQLHEVARELGMRPESLDELRNSAGPPPDMHTNLQLAAALGRLTEIDTLLLYSHAAHLDYQLGRMLADATRQINKRLRTGRRRPPEGLLEAVTREEPASDPEGQPSSADTSEQQDESGSFLSGLTGDEGGDQQQMLKILLGMLAGNSEEQGESAQMQMLLNLLGEDVGETLQTLKVLSALMQQADSD